MKALPLATYRAHRYHWIRQLETLRAMARIGTASASVLARMRKEAVRELAKLRNQLAG